jgi:hypothetical protein
MQAKPFSTGARVKGIYHGRAYVGVVVCGRFHTMNNSYMHTIVLDSPITVFGTERHRITVSILEPKEAHNTIQAA